MRKTKIIATLGPASFDKKTIRALAESGVNVFRLNFSHGAHDQLRGVTQTIRDIELEMNRVLCILADLQGPKLRIGEFENGAIQLQQGQSFTFDMDESKMGTQERIALPHPEIFAAINIGDFLFLDDGNVRMRVTANTSDTITAQVEAGDTLSNRKGVNVPGAVLPLPALTDKDKQDLDVALDMGVDWIAQSFVQTADDLKDARKIIGDRAALMAKIEKPSAVEHIEDIIHNADGIMLARGDLGVEIPPQDVPSVQKRIIRKAREAGKPVVVATQMLESMVHNARPTRAEASDVATAVYDGADAVMLSAETAIGEYPIEAVKMMAKICKRTENDTTYERIMDIDHPATTLDLDTPTNPSEAITAAAYLVAEDVNAQFIVTYTTSGSTTLRMARHRPAVMVLCLTPQLKTARQMAMSYSVYSVQISEKMEDFTGPARKAARIAKEHNIGQAGDGFVLTAGVPFGEIGTTNLLRICSIKT